MKTFLAALFLPVALQAASLTFSIKYVPSTQEMAGLSTNAYATNLVFILVSTTDVTQPTNQWPITATWTATSMTNQGPLGSVWTNNASSDSQSRFFALMATNTTSGTVGPFSDAKPFFQAPGQGLILSVGKGP